MPNPHRTSTSDPDARGMWLRSRGAPERFPTFAGILPVMDCDLDDLSLSDEPTEEVTLTPVSDALQTQNREGITLEPAPERSPRATRRPRPSPLFGEGEIDSPYPIRATQYMEGRQSTLWETDLTDPGIEPDAVAQPDWVPHSHDESVTLEVDEKWRAQIRTLDAEHARNTVPMEAVSHTVPSAFMNLDVVEPVDLPFDEFGHDDLCTDDLVLDEADARNHLKKQTSQPAPLPSVPAVETTSLAMRAPLPARSYTPQPAPVQAPRQVTLGQRAVHAVEATAWFTLGALVFSGTGAASSLLVVAMLFAG